MSEREFYERNYPLPKQKDDGSFGMPDTDKFNGDTPEEVMKKVKEYKQKKGLWEEDPKVI